MECITEPANMATLLELLLDAILLYNGPEFGLRSSPVFTKQFVLKRVQSDIYSKKLGRDMYRSCYIGTRLLVKVSGENT